LKYLSKEYNKQKGGLKQMAKEASVSGAGLCPFSWIEVTEPAGCLSALFGGKGQLVWKPQPCMGAQCKLWDTKEGNCGLVTKKS